MAADSEETQAEAKQRQLRALTMYWLAEIKRHRGKESKWREKSFAVVRRYRDDRGDYEDNEAKFNILWANTEVMKPAIMSRMPVADVRRRWSTRNPPARLAALMLERALTYCMSTYDFKDVLERVREDYLLPGRAECLVCYEPLILKRPVQPLPPGQDAPETEVPAVEPPMEEYKAWESVYARYVRWDMFGFSDCTQWSECPAVWVGEYMTRDQIKRYFPQFEDIDRLPFTSPQSSEMDHDKTEKERQPTNTVCIWKVWHKDTRMYMVMCDGYEAGPIAMVQDPQQLEKFFPFPEPLYSLRNNTHWMPKPEFLLYQDQAIELDEVVNRLKNLVKACKIRGVYDQAMDAVAKISDLVKSPDLTFMAIPNFTQLAEKGGLEALVSMMPIEQIAIVIKQLSEREIQLKAEIYEIYGIADIMRGASDSSETLGAQELKAQYGGMRVGDRQQRFQGFIRDVMRIKAEIIAEHFDPQTLRIMCGIEVLPDALYEQAKAQQSLESGQVSESVFMQACAIIKSDKLRGFNVDIETDSTIPVDKRSEQENRVAFMGAIGQYLQGVIPAVQSGAIPIKVAREGLLFVVRGFKIGTELEEVLNELGEDGDAQEQMAQMKQMLEQAKAENAQLKQDMAKLQSDQQTKQAQAVSDIQIDQATAQNDMQIDRAKAANSISIDKQRAAATPAPERFQ